MNSPLGVVGWIAGIPRFTEPALCAQADPELFHPDKGQSAAKAREICSRCQARLECLQYALDYDVRWGVYGGLTADERKQLLRARRQRRTG